jgi:hypothetical protein
MSCIAESKKMETVVNYNLSAPLIVRAGKQLQDKV